MENYDKTINSALEKLCENKVIPKEKLLKITDDIESLKKKLSELSQQELDTILKKIPESEIEYIKNQLT